MTNVASENTAIVPVHTSKEQGLKAIDALIKKVQPSYQKSHDLVQQTAVAIVEHAQAYGDCTRALHLVKAVPVQQRRSLIMFFMHVSPIGVLLAKAEKDCKARFIKEDSKAYNPFNIELAKATPWHLMDEAQAAAEAISIGSGEVWDQLLKLAEKLKNAKDTDKKVYTLGAEQAATLAIEALAKARSAFLAAKDATPTRASDVVDPLAEAVAA